MLLVTWYSFSGPYLLRRACTWRSAPGRSGWGEAGQRQTGRQALELAPQSWASACPQGENQQSWADAGPTPATPTGGNSPLMDISGSDEEDIVLVSKGISEGTSNLTPKIPPRSILQGFSTILIQVLKSLGYRTPELGPGFCI